MENKPFAPACDRNKQVIFDKIKPILENKRCLLEIGSGTGQHAAFMAPQLKIRWICSDLKENHGAIKSWIKDIKNIKGPFEYQAGKSKLPIGQYDCVFSANAVHIMGWKEVKAMVKSLGDYLVAGSTVILYGPFNYDGKFTSESNEKFDKWLKDRDPKSGIRNFEDICKNMEKHGMLLQDDIEMPANNRILVFEKR